MYNQIIIKLLEIYIRITEHWICLWKNDIQMKFKWLLLLTFTVGDPSEFP